jgi:hypothetical protein
MKMKFGALALLMGAMFMNVVMTAEPQKTAALRNSDVVDLEKAGLPDDLILLKIQNGPTLFNTSAAELIKLKDDGVSETVITAMVKAGYGEKSHQSEKRIDDSDRPIAEVFGGYSFSRFDGLNTNGWTASFAGNPGKWFGIVGEVSQSFSRPLDFYGYSFSERLLNYRGGPKFSMRTNTGLTPFFQLLIGGTSSNVSGFSESGISAAVGGGLDVTTNAHMAIRVIQVDYDYMHFGAADNSHGIRLSAGPVFRF